ncbi:MAG: bifunctional glutathionylspermidine amidase/synthase [Pseudomonadota bacterium]
MQSKARKPPARFGTLLGMAPGGVPIYSSDYDSADEREYPTRQSYQSHIDGVFMGYKWQCVEFARRWLYLNRGYIFDDIPMAYDIFDLRFARRVSDGELLPLQAFRNGSRRLPEPGCMLIWNEGGEFERTGHVAIVTRVEPDFLWVVEQNVDHQVWAPGQACSRELKTRLTEDGEYWIQCALGGAEILGWVVQTADPAFAECREELDPCLLDLRPRRAAERPRAPSWLNMANDDEAAYVQMMGGHRLAGGDPLRYFALSRSAERELRLATNDLHAKFLYATDWVLRDDALLARFNLPPAVWPKIRRSWSNRHSQMITGRFDFAVSARGIKLYEYNADSASCAMECGKIQGRWARHFDVEEGCDPGAGLFGQLVQAWRRSGVDSVLHIMQDRDLEETYHALFMKSALEAAGIRCKILHGIEGLSWGRAGAVLDPDGVEIQWVWKTWAWETALDQIRAECEEDERKLHEYRFDQVRREAPRLVDVLLRDRVMVFEPLWTLIPSNKAILQVLWALFPDCPYLLETHFDLTADLAERGHVEKPIAGRCGANVRIHGPERRVIGATGGRFERQERIYQAWWPLPAFDGQFVQVCTFTVDGWHAGTCLRADRSPVITSTSDVPPLRILDDGEFMSPG